MTGDALVAEHRRLGRAARDHKRAAARHRKSAQLARAQQAEIEAECRKRGIAVSIHTEGEGDIHGRSPGAAA